MLFSCSSLQLGIKKGGDENLTKITNSLLKRLKEENISSLSLDRGYHSYTGTLAKVREKLIEGGIQI
ncbi:50S ribosomal protein L18 [Mycoplasma wenyonii str. Massachusetts]|uniref:50S ribosomal protein L18 n=2 Tax=Mycoplasma wenyonii TaxID=65123 RepID=I6YB00_MYCWM|nr:50S ribosomal protein L18 [Mycoplasma wenyonii str. Massachusetts]